MAKVIMDRSGLCASIGNVGDRCVRLQAHRVGALCPGCRFKQIRVCFYFVSVIVNLDRLEKGFEVQILEYRIIFAESSLTVFGWHQIHTYLFFELK